MQGITNVAEALEVIKSSKEIAKKLNKAQSLKVEELESLEREIKELQKACNIALNHVVEPLKLAKKIELKK